MITGLPTLVDLAAAVVALVIGAVVASILLGGWLARVAGPAAGGLGWRLLARSAALATGVVPVAVGLVSWSWLAGWAAGLGAVIGAAWRVRDASGSSLSAPALALVAGGAIATLAPATAVFGLLVGLLVAGIARLAHGGAHVRPSAAGTIAGAVVVVLAAMPLGLDPGQLGGVLVLALIGVATVVSAGRGTPTR